MDKGLQKLPRKQEPGNLPSIALASFLYPLVLPLEDSDFPTRLPTSLLFLGISQVKLGAQTRNLPRKSLATGNKTQARAHRGMHRFPTQR